MNEKRRALRIWLIRAIRAAIFLAVVIGIGWAIRRSFREMENHEFQFSKVDPWGFVFACMWYSAGMLPCWIYWHRILVVMKQRPTWRESFRAFFIGQLGKYVPGKATVVALRADWVRSDRTRVAPAAASVFIETLTMMAVGAWLACSYLIVAPDRRAPDAPLSSTTLLVLSIVLMLVAGVPIWPPFFRRLVRLVGVHRADPEIESSLADIDLRLMLSGWALNLLAWACWGMSLLVILRSLPDVSATWSQWPLMTACVALAMVAGFLSLIPGGLGVRELIILTLLSPFGATPALVAAIVLRLAWLLSEVVLATILYMGTWVPRRGRAV